MGKPDLPPQRLRQRVLTLLKRDLWKFIAAYVLLLAVMAWLGRWTPEYLAGRDLWHFLVTRMIVAMVMLGVLASFIRLFPAALLLAATLLLVGTISAIKRDATGEPFQVSDLFLSAHAPALLGYVDWSYWLAGALVIPAVVYALRSIRVRLWSLPLALVCAGLLSTYRLEPVVKWIHDNSYWIGVENLTFSQAESERMNGLATHLYFSTAGLRLKTFTDAEVRAAMAALDVPPPPPARTAPLPDVFVVLGEAWWRDPSDAQSPIDKLVAAGFTEGTAISPVYGGTTPNAEFEVLTGIPAHSFMSGIIPYQHFVQYFSEHTRSLPRLLHAFGYEAHAYHNFERRFWLRDQVYPLLGFASFDSMETMALQKQKNGWPTDAGLFAAVAKHIDSTAPQFHFIVTVQTHGPYAEDKARDAISGERHPGMTDYHERLSGAADAVVAFNEQLRARGKPYVLFVFGDHLPGTRTHQWKLGMKSETDPRLHQVPFLATSNSDDVAELRSRLQDKPLYCVAPLLTDWLKIPLADTYLRHMVNACAGNGAGGAAPSEAIIQHQLFSKTAG